MQENKKILSSRPCPVCGSTDTSQVLAESNCAEAVLESLAFGSSKFPEYLHLRMICCPTCDLLYATPSLPAELLGGAYEQTVYQNSEEAIYAARAYARCLKRMLHNLPAREGALDIGTGDGAFLEQLKMAGFSKIKGVEPSKAAILAAKEAIGPLIKCGIFSPEDYEQESLNLITCFQTLEHVDDPFSLCRSSYNLLKKGGAVFFVAHNYRSFLAKIMGTKSPIFCLEHLQLNSPKSLKYMLRQVGFERIEVRSISNVYPLHYWVRLAPLNQSLKERLISFLEVIGMARLPIYMRVGNLLAIGYK